MEDQAEARRAKEAAARFPMAMEQMLDLGLFNQYLRNEHVQKFFFPNLALLSHASLVGATHEEVVPCALA
jgi:hypothetical protein